MSEDNFNKIAKFICDKHGNIVHEVCHVPRVTDLEDFYKIYDLEEKSVGEKYDKEPKIAPTIDLFKATFKQLEVYPANLQKPKKTHQMRERLNSTMSKSSPALNESTGSTGPNNYKETFLSLLNLNKFDVPSVSETLSSFIQFQKQLKQLDMEILQQDSEKEYVNKLKQLSTFAQQLEKLLPTEKVGKSALTTEDEDILEYMVKRMDDMNFIRNHQDVFGQQNGAINTANKLENLVDILSHCLLSVNSFSMD